MAASPAGRSDAVAHSYPRKTYSLLALIILAWGGNYPLMKLALADVAPLAFTAIRLLGASAVLAVALVLSGQRQFIPARGERLPLAIIGLFQIAAMFGLTIIGLGSVPPGRTVLLVYTMQLWAVPLGVWLLGEKLPVAKVAGALIGFAGILVFFRPDVIDWHDRGALLGSGMILLGSMCWAFGSCLYRRRVWKTGFAAQTLWQIFIAFVPILLLSLLFEYGRDFHPTLRLAAIVVFNWLVATAFAMWCWSKVLSVMPASTAGQILLLTPLVGFLLSAVFLGESVPPALIASAALITAGIYVTMRSEAGA
jgi:drug/metabolite transporter (DMT)-like permease